MLPELVLDNENFDEIMIAARNRIVSLYPEWTDFNYHDPGMTLIEMFSWLKESQQFFMDQVGEDARTAYLKLLGMRRRTKIPARTRVQVRPPEDITVLEGTRLWAGDTCFETEEKKQLIAGDAAVCISAGEQLFWKADRSRLSLGYGLRMPAFGDRPEKGNCLYVGFDHRLPAGEPLDMWLEFYDGYPVKRNPVEKEMAEPVARLKLEYYGEGAWKQAEAVRDETLGAIRSGRICFRLPGAMDQAELFGTDGFFLRIRLESQSYEAPPILESLSVNSLLVTQRERIVESVDTEYFMEDEDTGFCQVETLEALNGKNDLFLKGKKGYLHLSAFQKKPDFETGVTTFRFQIPKDMGELEGIRVISLRPESENRKFLGEGTGFPGQEYRMNDPLTEYETFGLMVREGDWYVSWEKVEDFSGSGPEDRHYMLDSRTGTVRFGNCIQGMAPESEILIFSLTRTKGRKGNVKAGTIDHFDGMEPETVPVCNPLDCKGGRDEESLDESFLRARRELKSPLTAVSNRDIERCVMETPGLMLENCRVIEADQMARIRSRVDDTKIYIVVDPFSQGEERGLSSCYCRNILAWMEERRMAGRQLVLLSPQYVPFECYADVVLLPNDSGGREQVKEMVQAYFDEIHNEFGGRVEYGELYGRIDMLPCVKRINSLNLDARGAGVTREKDGSLSLPPNGVPRLKGTQYMFSIG